MIYPLPANPADLKPTIIVDSREQAPLVFKRLTAVRGTLQTGDYSFAGGEELFAVERKSIADLIACCGPERERFGRELHRLRGFHFARLLVVGPPAEVTQHRYRSAMTPQAILASLAAFEVRYVPVAWAVTPEQAAERIESWVCWLARELLKAAESVRKGAEVETATTCRPPPPVGSLLKPGSEGQVGARAADFRE